jgi:hypothetical protein
MKKVLGPEYANKLHTVTSLAEKLLEMGPTAEDEVSY